MITLLTGKKGSGKTKKLIEMANEAVKNSNGNVVVVEKGLKLTYDISHAARLIDIDSYDVQGGKGLYGFLAGICAGNYDVTDIFVDSALKIAGTGRFWTTAIALTTLAAGFDIIGTRSAKSIVDELPIFESMVKNFEVR